MTALPQTVTSQPSRLRDRLLVASITFAVPAVLIAVICIAFTSIG